MYYYYPAALLPRFVELRVRYRKYRNNRFNLVRTSLGVKLELPDREVFICPPGKGYSIEADCVYPLHPASVGIARYLVSAHEVSPNKVPLLCSSSETTRPKLMMDSGGAQIYVGTTDYINPVRLIALNQHVGSYLSVTLDFPLRKNSLTLSYAKASAYAQKKVARRFFYPNKDKVNWVAPIQGRTDWMYEIWKKVVWEDWYYAPALTAVHPSYAFKAPDLHRFTGKDTMHILGNGSPSKFPILAWLGRYIKELSSDSSSSVSQSNTLGYYLFIPGALFTRTYLGNRATLPFVPETPLPCNCPACQALKWAGAFTLGSAVFSSALVWHNTLQLVRLADYLAKAAVSYSLEDFLELVKLAGVESSFNNYELRDVLEYISIFYEDSPKEARRFLQKRSSLGQRNRKFKPSSIWNEKEKPKRSSDRTFVAKLAKHSLNYALSCFLTKEELSRFNLKFVNPNKAIGYLPPLQRYRKHKKLYEAVLNNA